MTAGAPQAAVVPSDGAPRRRFRAPRESGGVLLDPVWTETGDALARNEALLASPAWRQCAISGRTLGDLTIQAREELLRAAVDYTGAYREVERERVAAARRIVLAGHQPTLFHPGVWFKNFALGRLAAEQQAVAVNLVIDSDDCRAPSIPVPGGSIEEPVVQSIAYDAPLTPLPYEERPIFDAALLASFAQRAGEHLRPLAPNPLLAELWPLVLEQAQVTNRLGLAIAQGRHRLEAAWGLDTLEVPQSRLASQPANLWLAAHVLAHLPRFRHTYNEAIADYGRRHHVRSASHPAPPLAADGEWHEAPFWLWSERDPRRRRAFARRRGEVVLLSDRQELEIELPIAPGGSAARAVAALAALAEQGVRLRTRALFTTLNARLLWGDAFLHGIGGGKYDEVTDRIIARFFGLAPPEFLVVSATLTLPLDFPHVTDDDVRRVDHLVRELAYHPEEHLDPQLPGTSDDERARIREVVAEKRRWLATEQTEDNAAARHRALVEANRALQPYVAARRAQWLAERDELQAHVRRTRMLASRDYSFCLFSASQLRRFMLEFCGASA